MNSCTMKDNIITNKQPITFNHKKAVKSVIQAYTIKASARIAA